MTIKDEGWPIYEANFYLLKLKLGKTPIDSKSLVQMR